MKNIIEIKNLKKSFGKKEVHKGINLDIYEGETLAIIGRNGVGKTVLVEQIAKIMSSDSGEIKYNLGTDNIFEEIGIQFQTEDGGRSHLRPKNLIHFYRTLYGEERINNEKLDEMIKVFKCDDYLGQKISSLSGGQRQRVNLLLASLHNPKLLILDEFTTGLDIVSVYDILQYIKKLRSKINGTMVIISHNAKEIKDLSDRIILIEDGVVKEEFKTSEINKKYKGDFEEFLLEHLRGGDYEN